MIRQVELFLQSQGPVMTSEMMATEEFAQYRKKWWPPEIVGPNGPVHGKFIALLAKIKAGLDREMFGNGSRQDRR
jgi:hypothetical protein